jgi:hypothetical protein
MKRVVRPFAAPLALSLLGSVLAVSVAWAAAGSFSLFGGATTANGTVKLVSNTSNGPTNDDASGIAYTPSGPLTVNNLSNLSATLEGTSECGGGSPRFSVTLQSGKSIFVYVGDTPNFTSCSAGDTGNLIDDQDLRVDTSQIGGTFYDTWANAKVLAGGQTVTEIDFVVDSGWFFTDKSQEVLVKSVTVNGDTYPGATSVTSPTDKDECKDDGWKTFKNADGSPMFKNQGDCVSFVATGGKNPPAGGEVDDEGGKKNDDDGERHGPPANRGNERNKSEKPRGR